MISYAQNFEDVMLWRALGHVENGFYIDLGAQDPIVDSVSLAFYERGWRGIHVEPTPSYAQMLRVQRPGDMVIEAAVGNTGDMLAFFEIPDTGVSTADPQIAEQHRARGLQIREITVPCVRLSSIFKTCGKQEIHWMKVDIEGFEWSALKSWGNASARPWIVVVESTLPMTQIESYQRWEPLLLKRGYTPVYFDGLNRYYVSQEKAELKQAFSAPPNVFDNFSVNGTASTTIHRHLKARYSAELIEVGAHLQSANIEIEDLRQTIAARDVLHGEQMRERLSQLNARNEEVLQLERVRAAREEKFATDSGMQSQQNEELLRELVAMEQATATKLLDLQQKGECEREQLHYRYSAREQEIHAQILAIHREYGNEVEVMRRETAAESARVATVHAERLDCLRQQLTELVTETSAHRLAIEQEVVKKREISRREAEAERLKLARMHEVVASDLRRALLTREREFGAQILAFQEQATQSQRTYETESANRILELSRQHANEVAAAHQELADRQKYFQEQLESARRSCDELRELERGLQSQIDSLHSSRFSLQQTVHRLQLHVSAMNTSLSWRLTSPVRKVMTYFFPSQAISAGAWQDLIAPSFQPKVNGHSLQDNVLPVPISISSEGTMQLTVNKVASSGALGDSVINGIMASDDHEFVQRAYHLVFGRSADPEGAVYYLSQLRKGISRLFILSQLRFSTEGIAHAAKNPQLDEDIAVATHAKPVATTLEELMAFQGLEFIRAAYLTMLGREPDPAGMKNCIAQLRKGAAKAEILSQMQKSDERHSLLMSMQKIVSAVRRYGKSKNSVPESLVAPSNLRVERVAGATPTIDDLLNCDEQEFLRVSFMLILGRAPDLEAFGFYLNHLKAGVPRLHFLEEIECSPEARRRAAFVARIERAIRQYQVTTVRIIGPLARALMNDIEKLDSTSRSLRAIQFDHSLSIERFEQMEIQLKEVAFTGTVRARDIEHQLANIDKGIIGMKDNSAQRLDQINESISTLQRLTIEQGQQTMNAGQGGVGGIAVLSEVGEPEESENLRNLPAGARDIYVKLKAAVARYTPGVC
jgi:FkbM family methyltransferase